MRIPDSQYVHVLQTWRIVYCKTINVGFHYSYRFQLFAELVSIKFSIFANFTVILTNALAYFSLNFINRMMILVSSKFPMAFQKQEVYGIAIYIIIRTTRAIFDHACLFSTAHAQYHTV